MIRSFMLAFIFASASFAYSLSGLNMQSQDGFLDSLLEEIESVDVSFLNENENVRDEIKKYRVDINDLKKKLKNIRLEKEKKSVENEKEIENLVEDYSKNLEQLKKTYKYIMSKIKQPNNSDKLMTVHCKADYSNNLNCYKKRKRILELTEINLPNGAEGGAVLIGREK